MLINESFEYIKEHKIISILRNIPEEKLIKTVDAIYDGGVKIIEVTLNSPNAIEQIKTIKRKYESSILVGAGTVLSPSAAELAILNGADFVLAPTLDIEIIKLCNGYSKLAIPGVLTPNEIFNAILAGARMIKVFPINAMGPKYIKDIVAPLGKIEIISVGGVTLDNAKELFLNGAAALGVGSDLANKKHIEDNNFEEIKKIANNFQSIVREI